MLTPHPSPQAAGHSTRKFGQSAKPDSHPSQPDTHKAYFCDTIDFNVSFKWDTPKLKTQSFFSSLVSYVGKQLRPAIQIYFSEEKINQLLSNYAHMIMQSKSPNVLVANYSIAKLNGLLAVLLAAGVEASELDRRRREIMKQAIQENKAQFEENEYSIELLGIISRQKSKKNRRLVRSLTKVRQELAIHMEKLGNPNWYTAVRQTTIQLAQLERIQEMFTEQHEQAETQLTQWHSPAMTTGIQVRVSDFELESRHDLEKKKGELSVYFNKISTRSRYLNQQLQKHQTANRITEAEASLHQSILGLKNQGVVQ